MRTEAGRVPDEGGDECCSPGRVSVRPGWNLQAWSLARWMGSSKEPNGRNLQKSRQGVKSMDARGRQKATEGWKRLEGRPRGLKNERAPCQGLDLGLLQLGSSKPGGGAVLPKREGQYHAWR